MPQKLYRSFKAVLSWPATSFFFFFFLEERGKWNHIREKNLPREDAIWTGGALMVFSKYTWRLRSQKTKDAKNYTATIASAFSSGTADSRGGAQQVETSTLFSVHLLQDVEFREGATITSRSGLSILHTRCDLSIFLDKFAWLSSFYGRILRWLLERRST